MTADPKTGFKARLITLNLLTAGLALFIAATLLVANEYFSLRTSLANNLMAAARIVGDNGTAALTFDDKAAASEILATLRAMPSVTRAAIYTREGGLFATYQGRGGRKLEATIESGAENVRYHSDRVELYQPILLHNRILGTVFIESDLSDLDARLVRYGAIAVAVIIMALGSSFLMLSRLRQRLTEAEEGLREANRTLEERVAARTTELVQANKELEAFSYSVSHDLRAPLRAINGFSYLFMEKEGDRLDAEGRHMLERVVRASNRMGELIDDILEYSRAGRLPLDRVEINMELLARSIAKDAGEDYPAASIEVGPLPSASGDAAMLRQILENLIGNALKYSCKRDDPRVEIGSLQLEGKTAFFVKDNGAGFDSRYSGKLFGMFQRMHTEEQFAGTGVGLAIVKRLVERHGGRVWAESVPDQGACFFFTLGD